MSSCFQQVIMRCTETTFLLCSPSFTKFGAHVYFDTRILIQQSTFKCFFTSWVTNTSTLMNCLTNHNQLARSKLHDIYVKMLIRACSVQQSCQSSSPSSHQFAAAEILFMLFFWKRCIAKFSARDARKPIALFHSSIYLDPHAKSRKALSSLVKQQLSLQW